MRQQNSFKYNRKLEQASQFTKIKPKLRTIKYLKKLNRNMRQQNSFKYNWKSEKKIYKYKEHNQSKELDLIKIQTLAEAKKKQRV